VAGAAWSAACTAAALLALVLSIPLWFVPPLVLVLPPLIWGWLTCRVLAFDVLAQHATPAERRQVLRQQRWPLLAMGVVRLPGCLALAAVGGQRGDADLCTAAGGGFGVAVHAGVRLFRLLVRALTRWPNCRRLRSVTGRLAHVWRRRPLPLRGARPGSNSNPDPPHEHRPHHRRRRNPLRQAPGQAPGQGHRAAGARGLALHWARYVGDDRAHHRRPAAMPLPAATWSSAAAASAPRRTTTRASALPPRWGSDLALHPEGKAP
jgi:hypothetical protein